MRIGIDGRKIPQAAQRGPIGSVEHAAELGLEGIFFRTMLDMSPDLDPGYLAGIRQRADELGLYLESGLGKVNPYASPETPELRRIGDGDIVLGFTRMMQAAAAIGCDELWVGTANYKSIYTGRLAYDRFRTDVDWLDQLEATIKFLRRLAPIARDFGLHLNLETHEEITSFELVRIIEAVGEDVLGIVYDTGNPLQRVEHPLWTARRVAPYVRQTHIKDGLLETGADGVGFQMRTCGQGVVDFAAILPILAEQSRPGLNLTLENENERTPGTPAMVMLIELFHDDFLAGHPDLTAAERADYDELLHDCTRRIAAGTTPGLAAYSAEPFDYPDCVAHIQQSAEHLREVGRATGLSIGRPTPSLTS